MSGAQNPVSRFCVRLDCAPGALERVLQPFTVLSAAPRNMTLRPGGMGASLAVIEVAGVEPDRVLVLAQRLRQMPCVRSVRCVSLVDRVAPQTPAIDALEAVA